MTYAIAYSTDTKRYDLTVNGLYHSQHDTYVDAEIEAGRLVAEAAKTITPTQRIARLAVAANKALALGDKATYAELKRQALELKAAELGIEYSVFASEFADYQASKKQAA